MDQLKDSRYLKASSLVETMLALVIIMAVFGVGMLMYNNVVQSDGAALKVRAIAVSGELTAAAKAGDLNNDHFESDGITFNKTIERVGETERLWLLTITAITKEDRVVFQSKEMILVQPKNETI
jgi:hypothetical protein